MFQRQFFQKFIIFLIVIPILLIFPSQAYARIKHHHKQHQYQVAIGSIFKDEAPYLKEWIEFHQLVGVQHFYLYNNCSADNFQEVLQPYINAGIIELFDWPYPSSASMNFNTIQCNAYMNCIGYALGKAKWVAFLDIDEFLFPVQEDNLVNFLTKYEECSGVTAHWVAFGTSWVAKIPENALLIETLFLSENPNGNPHVKSIVRPEHVRGCHNPHSFVYKKGHGQVTADKVRFNGPILDAVKVDKIRINHYWTRDEYYLNNFKISRRQSWGDSSLTYDDQIKRLNSTPDTVIYKYVPKLREMMSK